MYFVFVYFHLLDLFFLWPAYPKEVTFLAQFGGLDVFENDSTFFVLQDCQETHWPLGMCKSLCRSKTKHSVANFPKSYSLHSHWGTKIFFARDLSNRLAGFQSLNLSSLVVGSLLVQMGVILNDPFYLKWEVISIMNVL